MRHSQCVHGYDGETGPYVLHVPTVPTPPRKVNITRIFPDVIELNWLSPTEPNGEVYYVIYYTPEGGTELSIDTGSNLTHYNLTGLESNKVYANIALQAVHLTGKSERSAVGAGQYTFKFIANYLIIIYFYYSPE